MGNNLRIPTMLSLILLASSANAYSLCNAQTHPFTGAIPAPITLTLAETRTVTVGGVARPVSVTGSVRVIDGCSFSTANLGFTGPSTAQWFGGMAGNTEGFRLSDAVIAANSNNSAGVYNFITAAGSFMSFYDFNEFRLFDPTTNVLIARAALPRVAGVGSGSPPAVTSAISALASPAAKVPISGQSPVANSPDTSAAQQIFTLFSGLISAVAAFALV